LSVGRDGQFPKALQISEELYCISEVPAPSVSCTGTRGSWTLCSVKWSGMEKYATTLNFCC